VLRVALGYGIIFTRSDLRQLIHAVNYSIFWCCYVVSHCDLDLWPLDLELLLHFGCRVFKLCTKFERNRIIHGWVAWVIDDLARFRRTILGGGAILPSGSQGCVDPSSPNLARTQSDHDYTRLCFRVRISCCIFKRGRLKIEWCWKRRQISHFLTPVKIRGGVGEISIPIIEALLTTEPPEYIWWPSTMRLLRAVYW